MRRFIKKLSLSILLLATVVSILLSLSSCAFLLPKVSDKLPDEEIIKVEKVTVRGWEPNEIVELPQDKIDDFNDHLQELRYRKWINWKRVKTRPSDLIWFLITYETHTVKLGEYVIHVTKGEETSWTILSGVYPKDTFAEMFELFED